MTIDRRSIVTLLYIAVSSRKHGLLDQELQDSSICLLIGYGLTSHLVFETMPTITTAKDCREC